MLKQVKLPFYTRKHTLCDYIMKSNDGQDKTVWLDLTELRKSTGFQSVSLYDDENNLIGYRSVHILHKEGVY